MLTFGSLFAGIGGFDLGLERAGMVCKWQVEINPFCQKVLAKHWPDVERFGNVKDCGKHNLASVDLIAGGFPCQPHSVAGKQRGAEDDRNLWPEYRRIVAELRPTWVLAENVPGIRGTILDEVLSDLENLAYKAMPIDIPACAFNAPHRRERIFIVAHAEYNGRVETSGQQTIETMEQRARREKEASCAEQFERGDTRSTLSEDVADTTQLYRDGCNAHREQLAPGIISELGDRSSEARQTSDWWTVEPDVGRVANGVPRRVDRLRALGNAVVPQVVEWLGRRIVEVENGRS